VILVDEVSECALVTSAKGFDHAHVVIRRDLRGA
jgi:hypothetical protein